MTRIASAALLFAMAVVVAASAWLRLNGPRADCASWPLCRFEQRVEPAAATLPSDAGLVRPVHRVAASIVLLLVLALAWQAWRERRRDALRLLLALLALALALSALGIATPGSRSAAVLLGNLLGGAAMFALAWTLWRAPRGAVAMPARLRRSARVLALLWVAQAALGALSGAATGPVATLAHLLLAPLLAVAGFVLALALRRAQCTRAADALVALLLLQVGLGAAAALGAAAPALVLAHNGGAVGGLALLARWAFVPGGAAPGD